jgi:CheY-like chemotaxis protein
MSRHALIIEDEILIAYEIQDVLERLGFESFDLAASPAEAVACATAQRPSLITADMRIVGGTGLEAVRAIVRAIGEVPVVYVTANALAQACSRACGLSF